MHMKYLEKVNGKYALENKYKYKYISILNIFLILDQNILTFSNYFSMVLLSTLLFWKIMYIQLLL